MNNYTFFLPMKHPIKAALLFCFFLILPGLENLVSAQKFLPTFSRINPIQQDTNNFYFNEIWLQSKDVNQDYAFGYTKRAFEKIHLGYLKEALADIDQSIKIDSTISYNYSLKGYIRFSEDSLLVARSFINKAIMLGDSSAETYYTLGEICMKENNLTDADRYYVKCTDINPEFYLAWFKRAIIANLNGNFKMSEKLYKKVLKMKPDYGLAYYNLATLHFYTDIDKTRMYLNKAIAHDTTNASAYFFRGLLSLFYTGIAKSNMEDWGKAIKLDPANINYLTFRGILNVHKKNYNQGIDDLIRVIYLTKDEDYTRDFAESAINQRIDDFYLQLSILCRDSVYFKYQERGQLNEALGSFYNGNHINANRIYDTILSTNTLKGIIYFLKGFNQEYLRHQELAIECYQNATLQDHFPFESYLRKGYCSFLLNKQRDAIDALNTFISGNDSIKFAYRCRGNAYLQILRYDSAILNYNSFLDLDSTETDIYFNRAICYMESGNLIGAINNFNIIITRFNPFDMQAVELLAECFYLAGDTLNALRLLTEKPKKASSFSQTGLVQFSISRSEGVKIDYLGPNGHLLRGLLFLHYSKYDSAILDFNFYIQLNAKNGLAYKYRGQAYYSKQKYKKALMDFSSALALDTNDLTARYNRGLVYYQLHKLDLAYNDFKVAESLGHPQAKKFIEVYLTNYEQNQ